MRIDFHWQLAEHIAPGKLPIYVEFIARGRHPERLFHDHETSEIVLVTAGGAVHLSGSGSRSRATPLRQGDVLVVHPGVVHGYEKTGDLELLNIVYDRRRLVLPMLDGYSLPLFDRFFPAEEEEEDADAGAAPVASLTKDALKEAVRRVDRLRLELDSFQPGALFQGLACFMDVLVTIARRSGHSRPKAQAERYWIGHVVQFMRAHFRETITLDRLAAVANMSRRNFCRRFRNAVGCSPLVYLTKARIDEAAKLLIHTEASIFEIAYQCGFYDSNHFCRRFREATGASPRVFRLQSRRSGGGGSIDSPGMADNE